MNRSLPQSSRRGIALLLVLWCVMVISTVLIVLAKLVQFDVETESAQDKRFEARQLALTGLALAMHPDIQRGNPLLRQSIDKQHRIEVAVESEDARLNLNILVEDGNRMEMLLRDWNVEEQSARIAADSLRDWTDVDSFKSLNGAEAGDIPLDSPFSRPENRPFLTLDEAEHVRGFEKAEAARPDWKNFFSVHSSNKLDLQDVSPELLQIFGRLTREQAQAFVTLRNGADGLPQTMDDVKIESMDTVKAIVPLSAVQELAMTNYFGTGGRLTRITSRGFCADVSYVISVVKSNGPRGDFVEWTEQ